MQDRRRTIPEPQYVYEYPGGWYHLRYNEPNGEKSMPWTRKDEKGQYCTSEEPVPDMPYMKVADEDASLFFVVEGEKCVDAIFQRLGFNALSGNKGGSYWCEAFSVPLAGKNVVIIPDNDETGRHYADMAHSDLQAKAASVRVFCPWEWWEDIEEHEDIYDAIRKHGAEEAREKLSGFIEGEVPPIKQECGEKRGKKHAVVSCPFIQFFRERNREIKLLNDAQLAAVMRSLVAFSETGVIDEPQDTAAAIVLFNMAQDFDRAAQKWANKAEKNKNAANIRWNNL